MIIFTLLIMIAIMVISMAVIRLILPKFHIASEAVYSSVSAYTADSTSEWCLYNYYKLNVDPLPTDELFYGNFDEGAGLTAYDTSGNGNDLTLVNGPTWTQGRWGGGLYFDGSNTPNDFAYCSDADCGGTGTGLDIGLNTDFTVTAWVYPVYFSNGVMAIASKRSGQTPPANWGWTLALSNQGFILAQLAVSNNDGGTAVWTEQSSTALVPAGTWSHVAMTIERTGAIILYFNGTEVGAGGIGPLDGKEGDSAAAFCVGGLDISANNDCRHFRFNGYIDDLRVFDRPLGAQEIRDMVPQADSLVMSNGSTYSAYYPANSANMSSCLEASLDFRLVGIYRGIVRSFELFE